MIYNGTYTVKNRETGEHRTFDIRTSRKLGARVVSMLTGSNNESDYTGFGFVKDAGIVVWKRLRESVYATYAKLLWALATGNETAFARYEVLVEKRCIRCNRKLTNPESIESGIGPECAGRLP